MASGGLNVYGELWRAQLEQLSSDPTPAIKSRIFWNTTQGRAKADTGSIISSFLLNDQNMVMGTNATAGNNVRWNRSANATLELLIGSDSTAEGSSTPANWGKLNTKLGNSLIDTYLDYTEVTAPSNPSSGSRRTYVKADGKLYIRSSSGTETAVGGGPTSLSIASKTANYTLTSTDDFVSGSASGGSFTLTLPDATLNTGKVFHLKRTDQTLANLITIATTSAQTIDGVTTQILATQNEDIQVVSDGSNWQILQRKIPSVWSTYSLVITGSTTNPTLYASTQLNVARWRRVGDSIQIRYQLIQQLPGTAGSGNYLFSIPSGLTIDTTKIDNSMFSFSHVGGCQISQDPVNDVASSTTEGHTFVYNTTNLGIKIISSVTVQAIMGSAAYSLGNAMVVLFDATVPISNWGA